MTEYHYLNGKWVTANEMKISCFDLTVLRGFGVFDFLRAYNRKPFLLNEHLDRLLRSADLVGLVIPHSREELAEIVYQGIRRSPHTNIYIKLIFTGGESPDGITPQPGKGILFATFTRANTYAESLYTEGTGIMTHVFQRYVPDAKSLNYFTAVVTLQNAKKTMAASEVLYVNPVTGYLLEGTTVNFWGVIDGKIYTAEQDILYGCTRGFVLDLCKELEIEVIRGPVPCRLLPRFEEAFITSTTKEVMPITTIDGRPVGNGKVGPVTKKLMSAFRNYILTHFGESKL
jgi:branched-chain amino acid aminotransferase